MNHKTELRETRVTIAILAASMLAVIIFAWWLQHAFAQDDARIVVSAFLVFTQMALAHSVYRINEDAGFHRRALAIENGQRVKISFPEKNREIALAGRVIVKSECVTNEGGRNFDFNDKGCIAWGEEAVVVGADYDDESVILRYLGQEGSESAEVLPKDTLFLASRQWVLETTQRFEEQRLELEKDKVLRAVALQAEKDKVRNAVS